MAKSYTIQPRPRKEGAIDFEAELNPQQLAAVTSPPGRALVIAGAGSGKTRTLTYRVAYLLENGIAPENILLLTFTNKAAREMLERVAEIAPGDVSRLWGGTFHSVGNRILRRHAERIGFTHSFSILDREDQKEVMAGAVSDAGIDAKAVKFPKPELLADLFSLAANTGDDLYELLSARYPYFAHLSDEIAQVQGAYTERKREANSMDFDDLLVLTVRLLEEEEDVREEFQYRFQFILVDEFQDTNAVQSDLVELLAGKHGNVMVVGDDAQSIYSWRGADFENILRFPERYPDTVVHKIETNYRSVPGVLDLANAALTANRRQFQKALRATREAGASLPAHVVVDDPSQQAQFVAQRLTELQDEGVEPGEIAVLYRAHYQAMELQLELTNRGIPFVITSGLRFFEQAHVKDVAAFMKFAVNRRDEVGFKRMVRLLPGVGNASANKLWSAWLASPGSRGERLEGAFSDYLLPMKVPAKAKAVWEQLAHTMDELVVEGEARPPTDMMHSVIEGVYDDILRATFSNYDNRRQDLEQLMNFGQGFSDTESFLGQLALLGGADGGPGGRSATKADDHDRVTLSSVHQAKGLEWDAVFVLWLTDGMFPGRRVIESGDEASMEEERRLFYVAVTRAKDHLYLVQPRMWPNNYSGDILQRPSRFLGDIPSDLVDEWSVGTGF